jgi:hypothetical protein
MMEVFQIAPAPGRALGLLAVFGALLLAILGLFAALAYGSRAARFHVIDDGLRIRSPFYGRTVPFEEMVPESIRVADLRVERELQPALRTNGIGLPGYSAGWFRLRGGQRALLFLTNRERVVHIATRNGYAILISARAADDLAAALSRRARAEPPAS